jgi:hypothetical protein
MSKAEIAAFHRVDRILEGTGDQTWSSEARKKER